jgi:hypothetical protein
MRWLTIGQSIAGAAVAAVAAVSGYCAWLGLLGYTGYPTAILSYGLRGFLPWTVYVTGSPDEWRYFSWSDALGNLREPAAFVPAIIAVVALMFVVVGVRRLLHSWWEAGLTSASS